MKRWDKINRLFSFDNCTLAQFEHENCRHQTDFTNKGHFTFALTIFTSYRLNHVHVEQHPDTRATDSSHKTGFFFNTSLCCAFCRSLIKYMFHFFPTFYSYLTSVKDFIWIYCAHLLCVFVIVQGLYTRRLHTVSSQHAVQPGNRSNTGHTVFRVRVSSADFTCLV